MALIVASHTERLRAYSIGGNAVYARERAYTVHLGGVFIVVRKRSVQERGREMGLVLFLHLLLQIGFYAPIIFLTIGRCARA